MINNNELHSEFNSDLKEEGFHVYSRNKSKIKGFYPKEFPSYDKEIDISKLEEGDFIIIRVFFLISKFPVFKADGGLIDLEIESIIDDVIYGNILTKLPDHFPLAQGTTIELSIDEIIKTISK